MTSKCFLFSVLQTISYYVTDKTIFIGFILNVSVKE